MNFNDPYCNQAVKQEQECGPAMSGLLPTPKTENQSIITRITELEATLEAVNRAFQDVFSRLNKIESAIGM